MVESTLRLSRCTPRRTRALALCVALGVQLSGVSGGAADLGAEPSTTAAVPSFTRDVMAVLSKAGCNMGVCHGNKNGKGGFKISLRGQDAAGDHAVLTTQFLGRRVDLTDPDASLALLKPLGAVPHEGGVRFERDSIEHRILREWIAAGCASDVGEAPLPTRLELEFTERLLEEPVREVQLGIRALFADGSTRDVTRLAVYEPVERLVTVSPQGVARFEAPGEATVIVRYLELQAPVRLTLVPRAPDFVWQAPPERNLIDEHVFRKLRALRVRPSELASDSEFLRRVFIDVLGVLPSADEARRFIADARPDKRGRLVDELLERPEFAAFWALKWSDLLRNEEKTLDAKGVRLFHEWIRESIASGKPMDRFVHELIAARGSTYTNPPANYYRAARDAVTRAESTAQLFLGTRLGCAKCHNHPFDRWTQDDYYGWASVFSRVRYKIIENRRRDSNDKHEFKGEQIVWMARRGDETDPRTGEAAPPRFLGGETPGAEAGADRLEQLADWIVDERNPFFARAQVNRIWYHLMGRGIVDPIDDFRSTNPPSHPELLDALAREFVSSGFDLRHVIRTIAGSSVYGLSSTPNKNNASDERNYSHALLRRLSAEQLLDAMSSVTGAEVTFNGYPDGTHALEVAGVMAVRDRDRRPALGDQFLRIFGKPPRLLTCECERSQETTMSQAFQLISGPTIDALLREPENRLGELLASDRPSAAIVDELYWSALSRAPSPGELQAAVAHIDGGAERRAGLEDVVWGLLNAKEFLFRR